MTADYATTLKKAWEHHSCPRTMCAAYDDDIPGKYCEGHAALLEMVDGYIDSRSRENWSTSNACAEERRRLRAAVGVNDA